MAFGKRRLDELGAYASGSQVFGARNAKGWKPQASSTANPKLFTRKSDCDHCELHHHRNTVCVPGRGARDAKYAFVGQAPGLQEDKVGRCFIGPAGQLLDDMLTHAGFKPEETYLTNLVKCYPPEDRKPLVGEITACADYLSTELAFLPESTVIVPVGDVAMRALTKKSGIKKWAGTVIECNGRNYFPIFHPAFILRVPKMLPKLQAQLRQLRKLGKAEAVPYRWRKLESGLIRSKIAGAVEEARRANELPPALTIDFETTSKDPEHAEPVCAAFYLKGWRSVLVADCAADPAEFKRLVKEAAKHTRWIAQNFKYEARCCRRWVGVWPTLCFDTMIAHSVLDENAAHDLETLAGLVGCDGYDLPMRVHLAGGGTHADAPPKLLHKYNAGDVWATYQLAIKFRKELRERPKLYKFYREHVSRHAQTLARIEATGVYVDQKQAKAVAKKYRDEVEALERKAKRRGVNLSSQPSCCEYAFEKLGLPITHTTPKGEPSLKKEALEELQEMNPTVGFLRALSRHRTLKSWLTNFVEKYPKLCDKDSLLHGSFNVHVAVTGRLSSSDPNLQNIPRTGEIKTVFGSRFRNGRIVQADFSQLELRLLAELSQDDRMLKAFANGVDIHANTGGFIFGKDPADITPDERHLGKETNFSVVYGMGPYALAHKLKCSDNKAKTYLRRWFTFHHGVRKLLRRWHDEARRNGRVRSPFGRVRHLPWAQSDEADSRRTVDRALRQAANFPIQHAASELMCMVLTHLTLDEGPDTFKGRGLETRIVGTVHDSMYADGPKREAEEVAELFRKTMQEWVLDQCDWLKSVPIIADVKIGKTWGG